MNNRTLLLLLLTLSTLLFSGCAASRARKELEKRRLAESLRPEWTRAITSLDKSYYWGVGEVSVINQTVTNTQKEKVKKIAFAEIANTIAVKVSSQTTLAQSSTEQNRQKILQQNIRMNSQVNLEGTELVDTYKDDYAYFELYRLNIGDYNDQLQQRINNSAAQSAELLHKGINARNAGDIRGALRYLLQSINALAEYAQEEIRINDNGSVINPMIEADRQIVSTLASVIITPLNPRLEVAPGTTISEKELAFTITDQQKRPISNLPLKVRTSGIAAAVAAGSSDSRGSFAFRQLYSITDQKSAEITLFLDLQSIVWEASVIEPIVKIAQQYTLPMARMTLTQKAPIVRLISPTPNNDDCLRILSEELSESGINTKPSGDAPLISINETISYKRQPGYTTANLFVTAQWNDRQGNRQQSQVIVSESAKNEQEALLKVRESFRKESKTRMIPSIISSIF